MQFKKVPELCQLAIQVFEDCIKLFLQRLLCHLAYRIMCWVVVYVGQQNRLRERWSDVLSRAAVPMSAGTYLFDC